MASQSNSCFAVSQICPVERLTTESGSITLITIVNHIRVHMLTALRKLRDNIMKLAAAVWLVAFVCLLVAMLGDGLLPAQVSVVLASAALSGLALVIGSILLAWVPVHDLIQRTRRALSQAPTGRLYAACDEFLSSALEQTSPPPRSAR